MAVRSNIKMQITTDDTKKEEVIASLTHLGIKNEVTEPNHVSFQLLGVTNGLERLAECLDSLEPLIYYTEITVVGSIKEEDCPQRTIYAYQNKLFTVTEKEDDLIVAFSLTYFMDDLRGKSEHYTTEETFKNREDERIVNIQNKLLRSFCCV